VNFGDLYLFRRELHMENSTPKVSIQAFEHSLLSHSASSSWLEMELDKADLLAASLPLACM
jgi:hypothetical protein